MMSSFRRYAVVIVNYESELVLRELLLDIRRCNPLRVYVVDNSLIEKLPVDFAVDGLDVSVIFPGGNIGFGSACNRGMSQAFSDGVDSVYLINPDVRFSGEVLDDMYSHYSASEDRYKIAVPSIVFEDAPEVVWYYGGDVTSILLQAKVRNYMKPLPFVENELEEKPITFASGCFMLLSKEVYEKTGGFDERIFLYEEDLDLSLRSLRLGINLQHYPWVVVRHICQYSSREKGEGFTPILSSDNKKLKFYLSNILKSKRIVYSNISGQGRRFFTRLIFRLYILALVVRYRRRRDVWPILAKEFFSWH